MSIERRKRWLGIAGFAAALYAAGNLFTPTVVVGESMSPTLKDGRVIWIDRTYYRNHKPAPGEVVVFRLDGMTYIKRVYRGPGERIDYISSGFDWIGAVRPPLVDDIRERYERTRSSIRMKYVTVPNDSVFVLGDNTSRSIDSRQLGPIPISAIIGRARLPIDTSPTWEVEFSPHSTRHAARRGGKATVQAVKPRETRGAKGAI
jgi:signal peptidase I